MSHPHKAGHGAQGSSEHQKAELARLEAERAKLAAEQVKIQNEDSRAKELHSVELERLRAEVKASRQWYFNPAVISVFVAVIGGLFAFGPQLMHLRAIYNADLEEQRAANLHEEASDLDIKKENIEFTNQILLQQRGDLLSSNTALARLNEQQTDLIASNREQLVRIQMERSLLLSQIQTAERKLRSKDLEKARARVADYVNDLENETRFDDLKWDRQPAEIEGLLATPWRTNILQYLTASVVWGGNYSARTRVVAAIILYHEDAGNAAAREFLLDMARTNQSWYTFNVLYDVSESTNELGHWRIADKYKVWQALLSRLPPNGSFYLLGELRPLLRVVDDYPLPPAELRQLVANLRGQEVEAHDSMLIDVGNSSVAGGVKGGYLVEILDPVLYVVTLAQTLANLPAVTNWDTAAGELYSEVLPLLGPGPDESLTNNPGLTGELDRLGIPRREGPRPKLPFYLTPWKRWVADPTNQPLIQAALSTNLETWRAVLARQLQGVE